MSVIGSNILAGASGQGGGYNISRSVRLRSSASAYFNRTLTTPTSASTWSFSCWLKRGSGINAGVSMGIFAADTSEFYFAADKFQYYRQGALAGASTAVYRDPSAWYHIVINSNGSTVNAYVNNQLSFTYSGTAPAFNTAIAHNIGRYAGASDYFDGYLTEINFIDGQALTPSSFGSTNGTTGVWQPAKYTGTYGTNGFYLPFNISTTSTYSGVFNGSAKYISAPNNALFAQQSATNWTVEGWVNSSSATLQEFFVYANSTVSTGNDVSFGISYTPGSTFNLFQYNGTTNTGVSSTLNVPSGQWAHIAAVNNGGTVTLYLNGVACGTTSAVNTNSTGTMLFYIGNYGSARYINGQVSNFRLVKGTAVYTANFTPPTGPLTAIANTVLLTLQNNTIIDNSTNAFTLTNTGSVTTTTATPFGTSIGSDASGNNNNWTPNNINYSTSTATTYDSMTDVPTLTSATAANFSVYNPLKLGSGGTWTVTNGNLSASNSGSSSYSILGSSIGMSSGKWYFEFTVNATGGIGNLDLGVLQDSNAFGGSVPSTCSIGQFATGYAYTSNGIVSNNNTNGSTYSSFTTNDVVQIALDLDNNKIYFGKNGTWQNSGNPATGTGSIYTVTAGTYFAAMGRTSVASLTVTATANFGQQPFSYTPPSGYVALNTYNLPTNTITNGATVMAASTYTGTGASQAIVNSGNNTGAISFKPDFIWIKSRSGAVDHVLTNSNVGATYGLSSNNTGAEFNQSANFSSFNSNGFTVQGTSSSYNQSAATYIAWQWQAGQGSTSSNTSGSITSTVSVNATAGFSVVTWTGVGSTGTIGHGLGVAPKFIITKYRNAVNAWCCYHITTGAGNIMYLSGTNAATANSTIWNNTAPTSSVFSVGDANTNQSGGTYVAYCWSEIAGYSKFGSFVGNASTDGPFVYTGFKSRFILFKASSTGGANYNWFIYDTSRNTYNVMSLYEEANTSAAEQTYAFIDVTANGFKLRNSSIYFNGSGVTYIYAAFAENPFKNALAR